MRKARVVLALALLFVLVGDGRKTSPELWSGTVGSCELFPGMCQAHKFWLQMSGAQRRALSMEPDGRELEAYARVVSRAGVLKLPVEPPALRVTKPELALLLGPGIKYVYAVHYTGPRIILLNGWFLDRFDDDDLEYVLAHELAHAIDMQNERQGHVYLETFRDTADADEVADALASVLVGPYKVHRFRMRYGKPDY